MPGKERFETSIPCQALLHPIALARRAGGNDAAGMDSRGGGSRLVVERARGGLAGTDAPGRTEEMKEAGRQRRGWRIRGPAKSEKKQRSRPKARSRRRNAHA